MRKVLLHAIQPSDARRWRTFCLEAGLSEARPTYVEQLAVNVWLISAGDPWLTVGELLHIARKSGIDCRTLEFDLESEWQDRPARQ